MKKINFKNLLIFLGLIFFLILPWLVLAGDPGGDLLGGGDKPLTLMNAFDQVNQFAGQGGYQTKGVLSPEFYIGRIINIVLSFLGAIFMVLMVYGGIQWLTSGGNEEKVTKAKDLIKHSVVGLLIVFAAFMLSYFVLAIVLNTIVGK